MIYDGRLMMPSSSQLDNAGQATNYCKLFASLQNIEVEHCRDAYGLLLELCYLRKVVLLIDLYFVSLEIRANLQCLQRRACCILLLCDS
mmetsp:Transcript_11826/g.20096  ORF Transcript_11826/g.20096 Transcript_11826/m.20096 type:complete len:89 (+) Transcript_11826:1198-1464(+)